ncbi:MAG: serine/threonine transporter SstT [Paraprevotella sp.]|nr:serine/threonine transporter SstT [Paraprevotella sp.]MDY2716415.1 serine/threonine transporter SstT [Bacteroidaceae bacterium]MCI7141604.1 serine/threonine transporter SstT [Paraprevotella sp.]MCI7747472.1 serine/threonine transporter SstT [Paraprevotella sp.]MDD5972020.1 serine/threonine transporter SstT [Paraprevotella sp.]
MKYILTSLWRAYTGTHLITRIFCGILLGAVLAILCPGINGISILGNLFVGALKSVAPILVAVLVTASVAQASGGLGKRFGTVIGLYISSTLIASLVAVLASRLFPVTLTLTGVDAGGEMAPAALSEVIGNLLLGLISNPISAVSNAAYLSVLFWSIVMGLALKNTRSQQAIQVIRQLADAVSLVVQWVIQFAPIGIMGLVYASVSESGLEIFATYGRLILLLVGCMLTVMLLINPLITFCLLRTNPYPLLWQCLRGSAVSAFFTRSSAANIPVNMSLCKRMGVDEDFYSVSIPLGSTINMDGAAITITVMSLAACHSAGIQVSLSSALILCILATLGACGTSGVAGGSLLLIPMACAPFGLPGDVAMQVVAIGFIIGVIQDSMETALNSSSDVLFTATADFYNRRKQR